MGGRPTRMQQSTHFVVNWASCATLQDRKKPLFPASARVKSAVVGICPGRQLPPLRLPLFRQRTTRPTDHELGVCSMRLLKRIAHPSFPPSGAHGTSPKASRNAEKRAPEIGARLIGFVVCSRRSARSLARTRSRSPARLGASCVSLRRRPMPRRRLSPRSASQRGPSRSS